MVDENKVMVILESRGAARGRKTALTEGGRGKLRVVVTKEPLSIPPISADLCHSQPPTP